MAAFLAGLQVLSLTGAIENEAEMHILEGQVRDLWNQHQGQIQSIASLYNFMDKMSFNQSLFDQINTCKEYSIQNWEMLAQEIQAQSDVVKGLSKSFSDKIANRLSMVESSYTGLYLSIVGFTIATFVFWKEVAPQQYQAAKATVKEWGKIIADKARYAAQKLKLVKPKQQGLYEQEIQGQQLQTKALESMADDPASEAAWGKGKIALTGLRIGFLAFMIYGFIKGRQSISALRDKLKEDRDYFSDKGKFNEEVQRVIDAVKIFTCDVSNLAQASRAVIENLHALYLTKAFVQRSSSYAASRANELTTAKFNLTDAFFDKTSTLTNQISSSDTNIKPLPDKLTSFLTHFKQFYNTQNNQIPPDQIFLHVTTQISSIVSSDSIINGDLAQKQNKLLALAKAAKIQFILRPSEKELAALEPDDRNSVDSQILQNIARKYKLLIIEDGQSQLDTQDQRILVSIISNYCNVFYGTDSTGQTIYGMKMADIKGKETYKELLDSTKGQNAAQTIYVHYDDQAREEKEVRRMLQIAKNIAQQNLTMFKQVADDPFTSIQNFTRYISLTRIATGIVGNTVPKVKLLGKNGLKFSSHGDLYLVQEEIVSLKQTLRKEGQV